MSLFLGNIPEIVGPEVIYEEFSIFGDAKLSYFVSTNQGKFAYIEYNTQKSAREAYLAWNGRIMAGHVLNLEYHFEQPEEPQTEPQAQPKVTEDENSKIFEENKIRIEKILFDNQELIEPSTIPEETKIIEMLQNTEKQEPKSTKNIENKEKSKKKHKDSDSESIERPKHKTSKFSLEVGDALIEANPEIFKILKKSRRRDADTLISCELCRREFKKKHIRDHINTRRHIENQSS